MLVSLNQIKQFTNLELPPVDELVDRINRQLGGVEEVIDLNEKYKDAIVARVVECGPHPDADRLTVVKIDDGGKLVNIERDDNGLIQVVCGAPNVHVGMFGVWLPPGSVVPASFDEAEPFKLDARKLRGVVSYGMLAAADELAIGSDHEGIIELTERDLKEPGELQAGASFAKLFGLDDTVIDIENKMFTHRPDLFGQLGIAREISAILQGVTGEDEGFIDTHYHNPDWYMQPVRLGQPDLSLDVFNQAADKVPRLTFAVMKDITIGSSPFWLQCALVVMGAKPVNNIVDLTNYVMLITAQPTHAYDYDKLRGGTIGARMAKKDETVTLLNGKTYQLTDADIVIADGEGPIGLGGVMGGLDSQVTTDTKNIVLECATFDMYAVRRSSMNHGLFTDAVTRFNKGQSPLQNIRVLSRLEQLISQVTGAKLASPLFDLPDTERNQETISRPIEVSTAMINSRLGSQLVTDQIGNLLRRVNFDSTPAGDSSDVLGYTAPFWRTDIELPEDIIEEVGRLYGFENLSRALPQRSITPAALNPSRELKRNIRRSLAQSGASEVLTYSFVHRRTLERAGQSPEQAYQIANSLSPDLQYYRLSVLPSLLDKVHGNIKAGHDEFALFEIGKSHDKQRGLDASGLPIESSEIALVFARKNAEDSAAFFRAKHLVGQLLDDIKVSHSFVPLTGQPETAAGAPFEAGRSAQILSQDGELLGLVGELRSGVRQAFKLSERTAAATLKLGVLLDSASSSTAYRPLSRFPSTDRDVCFEVDEKLAYGELISSLEAELEQISVRSTVRPVDIFQGIESTDRRITVRIRLAPESETLTSQAANGMTDRCTAAVAKKHQARIV